MSAFAKIPVVFVHVLVDALKCVTYVLSKRIVNAVMLSCTTKVTWLQMSVCLERLVVMMW